MISVGTTILLLKLKHSDSYKMFSENDDMINLLEYFFFFFFWRTYLLFFSMRVLQQTFGIHLTTISTTLLSDLFLYSDVADFMQVFLKKKDKNQIYIHIFFIVNFPFTCSKISAAPACGVDKVFLSLVWYKLKGLSI